MRENGAIDPSLVLLEAVKTGPVVLTTKGRSMEPNLRAGQSVKIERESLGFGQIAAFVGGDGEVVVHRHVCSIAGRSLFIGDANPRFDRFVRSAEIIGRVVSVDDGGEPERFRLTLVRRILRLLPREGRAFVRRRTRQRRGKR